MGDEGRVSDTKNDLAGMGGAGRASRQAPGIALTS